MDSLFRRSETQKKMEVSQSAWLKLNELLETDRKKEKLFRIRLVGMAATAVLLFSAFLIFQTHLKSDYHLENLDIVKFDHLYSSEDMVILNQSFNNLKNLGSVPLDRTD